MTADPVVRSSRLTVRMFLQDYVLPNRCSAFPLRTGAGAALWVGSAALDMGIGLDRLLAATASAVLLGLCFGGGVRDRRPAGGAAPVSQNRGDL